MGQVFAALVLVSVQFWHPGVTSFDAHHIQLPNGVNMGVNISAVYYIPKGANMQVQLTHVGVGNVLVNAGLEFTAFSAHRLS